MRYAAILSLARGIAKKHDISRNRRRLGEFMEDMFNAVTRRFNLCERGFQARAAIYGEAFQAIFTVIMEELFPDVRLIHGCEMEDACLMGVGKADFVVIDEEDRILAVIEAKGSADYIICNGRRIELHRPGLIRTDTTKKAIANAAQVKYGISGDIPYIIVTSHKPYEGSSSHCMLKLVEGKLVDMVVDVKRYDELREMVKLIRGAKPSKLIYRRGRAVRIGTR